MKPGFPMTAKSALNAFLELFGSFHVLGIFIMELGGLFYKFVTQNVTDVEYFVIPGFLIFLISLATP